MKDINLFKARNGAWVTTSLFRAGLEHVKAQEAAVLYMHTGLTFGLPNPELRRQELLAHLFEIVSSLCVPTLCVPTFTFSFCNGEDYNVQTSRSRMGALNEFIRSRPEAVRSVDPLMSVAVIGADLDLARALGKNSIGADSNFDKLHLRRGCKFLFLGASLSECFTYTHYVEERMQVPYRYNREFTGMITDGPATWEDTYVLFVRYKGVLPSGDSKLEKHLLAQGLLRKISCGDSSIACVDEPAAYEAISAQLQSDVYSYIAEDPRDRNTEFTVRNMVAL